MFLIKLTGTSNEGVQIEDFKLVDYPGFTNENNCVRYWNNFLKEHQYHEFTVGDREDFCIPEMLELDITQITKEQYNCIFGLFDKRFGSGVLDQLIELERDSWTS